MYLHKTIYPIWVVLLFRCAFAMGQTDWVWTADRRALGGVSAISREAAVIYQPAGLYGKQGIEFWLGSLATAFPAGIYQHSAAMAYRYPKSGFGVSYQTIGLQSFRNSRIQWAAARKLTSSFAMGIHLQHEITQRPESQTAHLLTGSIGFLVEPNAKFRWGCYLFNPFRLSYRTSEEKPDSRLHSAIAWQWSDRWTWEAELIRGLQHPFQLRSGFSFQPRDIIDFRVGWRVNPSSITGGIGLHLSFIQLYLSCDWNQWLGLQSALSIQYQWRRHEKAH